MKTLKTLVVTAVAFSSMAALGAPPPGAVPGGDGPPGMMRQRGHVAMVVAISEALELGEAEALKLSEKLKTIEDRRQPIRASMHEAMKAVRAAAQGEAAALTQVDANVQKVLDGRAQMAAMDKELFTFLAKDLPPQKKAKLALVLARLGQELRGGGGGGRGGRGGRWGHQR